MENSSSPKQEILNRSGKLEQELRMGKSEQIGEVCKIMDKRLKTEDSAERELADIESERSQKLVRAVGELKSGKYSDGSPLSDEEKEKRIESEDEYYGFFKSDIPHAFDLAGDLYPMDSKQIGEMDEAGLKQALETRQKKWEGTAEEWSRVQGFTEGLVEGEDWEGAAKAVGANSWLVQGGMVEKVGGKIRQVEGERGRDAASGALPLVDALVISEWVDVEVKNKLRIETAGARGYDLYVKGGRGEFRGGALGSPDKVDGRELYTYFEKAGLPFDRDEVVRMAEVFGYKVWDFGKPGVILARLTEGDGVSLGETDKRMVAGMLVEYARQTLSARERVANFGEEKAVAYAAEMLLAAGGVREVEKEITDLLRAEGGVRAKMDGLRNERAAADEKAKKEKEKPVEVGESEAAKVVREVVNPEAVSEGESVVELGKLVTDLRDLINGKGLKELGLDQTDPVFRLKVFATNPAYTTGMLKGDRYTVGGEGNRAELAKKVMDGYQIIRGVIEDPLNSEADWERASGLDGVRGRRVVSKQNLEELGGRSMEIEGVDGWEKDEDKVVEWAANRLARTWAGKVTVDKQGKNVV